MFPSPRPVAPPILYKYRSVSLKDHHLDIICQSEVWFSSPGAFNDPFDSNVAYFVDYSDIDKNISYATKALKREMPRWSLVKRRQFAKIRAEELMNDIENQKELEELHRQQMFDDFSMCCLSAHNDSVLMWAHYANNHRGICIGISTSSLNYMRDRMLKSYGIQVMLDSVKYQSDPPVVDFFDSMSGRIDTFERDVTLRTYTKSSEWSYEKEWRLMIMKSGERSGRLPNGAINNIILGCNISDEDRGIVTQLKNEYCPSSNMMQARRSRQGWSIEHEPIDD